MDHEDERIDSSRAWWRRRLAGLDAVLDLPADRPRRAVRDPRLERLTVPAGGRDGCLGPLELVAARPSREVDTAVLLAGVAGLCGRLTGRPDVALGTALTGDDGRPGLGVLRFRLGVATSFGALFTQARQEMREAMRWGPVPRDLAAATDPRWHPLTQVVVAVRARGEVAPDTAALRIAPGAAPFDLAWILDRSTDPATLLLEHDPLRFRLAGPELLAALQSLLARGLGDPAAPLSRLAPDRIPLA